MMDAIYFGDKINVCKEKLRSALIQSGQFYDLLCGDFISLKSIENLSSPLLQLKEELESSFIELFKINSSDIDLQYLTCIYIQVLDFQNRKIPEFQQLNSLESAQEQKKLKRYYLQQSHFTGKNCVIFCSLLQNTYVVNLASNSFSKIFGIHKDFIVGKQLNLLVPAIIKKNHDKMIQKFIDQDSLSLIERGQRSLFALDQQGFIFPISLRIKIENLSDDVGVCALIHRINKQKSYILFDDDGCITDFSKKLYYDLFQSSEKMLYDWQNIFRMIPFTQIIIQSKQLNTKFCSAMVIKQQFKNKLSNTQIETTTQAKNINLHSYNDDVFLIQFQVCQNQTRINVNVNYLEIENYEKETNQSKKNKIIDELNNQLIQQEQQDNQIKQINKNFEALNSYQYFLSERQLPQNIDSNNLLLMKWQEDQKFQQASRPNIKTEIPSTNRIHLIFNENEDFKEENMTKCFSEQQIPVNQNQKQEQFENQIDNLSWINKNDIPSSRNKSTKEIRNKEIPNIALQLKKTHTMSSNYLDFNQSPLVFSQHTQLLLLTNNQQDFNQIATTNSKRNIEQQGSNQFDFSINNFPSSNQNIAADQQYSNFQNTKNEDQQKANKLINKQNTINLVNSQKTLSDSDKCLSIEDNIFNKRKTKSTNFQEEEQEEKEQKKEQQNEIASVNSSKYSSEDLIKRNMIRRINQKVFNKSLQLMIFTGFIAIIILIVVTLIVYLQNLNSLDNFVASFLKIDGALFCFTDVMKIQALSNYQVLLGNTYIQDSQDIQNQQNILVNYELTAVLQDYNQNFEDLVLYNDSQDELNDLQNNPFLVQVFAAGFYDFTHIQFNSTVKFSQSLQYTIMQFYYEIIFYVINYEEQQEDFIWGNIVEFKSRMKNLQSIVESYAKTQFNNMNAQQMTVITLVSILSFLMIFSIIPLNIYIQIKREKVMKLFGTFQPQTLELQIRLIELAIFKIDKTKLANENYKKAQPSIIKSIKSSTKKQKHIYLKDLMEQALDTKTQNKKNLISNNYFQQAQQLPKYIRREQKPRNRSIASFNSLPKFNLIVILLGIVAVFLLLIQPALNILQFSPFKTESNATLQDRISLIDIFTLLIENQGSHIESILSLVTLQVPSTTYYYTYANNLTDQNEKAISQLQNLTTNLGIQRYNQNMFEDFYKNILNSNLCQVRQNFPQYFNSNVTQATCERVFNGILKRGLILSINRVFQTFEELLEMYAIQDLDQQLNFYIQFQSQYSYVDFKLLIQVISESVDAIRQYQDESLQEYKQHVKFNLFQLFIAQLFIIILVFFIGWLRLFYSFVDQLAKTKNIFKVFHINVLYENDYIQSYFRQMQIKQNK
ncbi:transmembrane protein, putative (macronuclear) [Tetrahymena thermophila SB210]|uniref:Transmembrane protein, putative n=1 Tax=Tetrahymena thermophila (strain SB210) TaxID=312017 RepID=W7X9F0_TETTS|nr:transmembrane protein, putative [Tetrahymena thermophila SB210]EWS76030.1 transmembrane protein, putative [Tetrahymena thermophila SB210]|eukprot:XP_012651435.1 transmembrane protein, putative [Tetrahymena thermophila SB210]